jgi:hypothetical protein
LVPDTATRYVIDQIAGDHIKARFWKLEIRLANQLAIHPIRSVGRPDR